MNSGSITGDTASYGNGGGISNSGILNLNGGSITGNTASNGYGGGIYSDSGYMNLNGGSITGTQVAIKSNRAHLPAAESSWYKGYGVYLDYGTTPTITGGFDPTTQVTDNTQI